MAIIVYNGTVTTGGTDGKPVTQDNPIVVSADRGTVSEALNLALRATGPFHFLCNIKVTGKDAEAVQLSLDGVTWSQNLFIQQADTVNRLFFLRTVVGDEEDYGDNTTVSLKLDYYQPV
ncbi:hypothetical protein [Propionispora hippei]|uniref:Uncharacterized protein n=1 Tax=Propionispora hippei DSM 15287 TaxID=1123003 RepID=A0A1M6GRZ7_9FIRM|nr:hypothetical protein [Propionispora hippei]SHJ12723.1 hypothetical protein SAMN02745170_01804 [Propionispora hippei DSM 15287]